MSCTLTFSYPLHTTTMAGSSVAGAESQDGGMGTEQTHSNNTTESPLQRETCSCNPTADLNTMDENLMGGAIQPCDSVSNHGDNGQDEGVTDENLESDASSRASDDGSTTSSTYQYGQEAFETFKLKVIQLCQDIGYGVPVEVERMHGGSFNRVIGLYFESPEKKSCVLRIPRDALDEEDSHEISDQISVILHLAQYEFLKVPSILAFDTTANNAVKSQWVLQSRLPGKSMDEVFYKLPLEERLQVATKVAELFTQMSKIKLEKTGRVVGTGVLPKSSNNAAQLKPNIEITSFRRVDQMMDEADITSTLMALFEKHKQNVLQNDPNPNLLSKMTTVYDKLQSIVREMHAAGLMREGDCSSTLWHWDLCPRNILIDCLHQTSEPASLLECTPAEAVAENDASLQQLQSVGSCSLTKICHHTLNIAVEDGANGHNHSVTVELNNSQAGKCYHAVTVTIDDEFGQTYHHKLEIINGKKRPECSDQGSDGREDAMVKQPLEVQSTTKWEITGILDWDDVLSVPLVVVRNAHTWLWLDEEKRSLEWNYDRDSPPHRDLTQDELLIKAHFDQVMARGDPSYTDDTYRRGIWVRAVARLAIYDFETGTDFERYEKLVKDWDIYFQSLGVKTLEAVQSKDLEKGYIEALVVECAAKEGENGC